MSKHILLKDYVGSEQRGNWGVKTLACIFIRPFVMVLFLVSKTAQKKKPRRHKGKLLKLVAVLSHSKNPFMSRERQDNP